MKVSLVIVTGARDCPYPAVVHGALDKTYVQYGPFAMFHGACQPPGEEEMVGADRYASDWAKTVTGVAVTPFPADWRRWRASAGPLRNRDMVATAVNLFPRQEILGLAFPGPRSRGTIDCMEVMGGFNITVDRWGPERARRWLKEHVERKDGSGH